jgi:hypothetical protein
MLRIQEILGHFVIHGKFIQVCLKSNLFRTGEIRNSYEDLWIIIPLIIGLLIVAFLMILPLFIHKYCRNACPCKVSRNRDLTLILFSVSLFGLIDFCQFCIILAVTVFYVTIKNTHLKIPHLIHPTRLNLDRVEDRKT